MKIFKKFLAVMLTLAMVFSMCAFTVSAYDTPTLFSKMDFNALTLGTSYTRSTSFVSTDYHSSYSGGNTIYVRSDGTGSVNVAGTEEDKYISTSWTTGVGHNYIYTYWNMNDNGIASTNNTLHIGYDVMVPATAKDTTTGHYELRCFNTSTSGSCKSNYYATVSINVANGEISATVDNTNSSATNTASVDKAVAVKGDDWQNVDLYITRHSNFKDDIVVAVDNKVIYKSEYTSTADMYLTVVTDDFIGDGSTFVNYDNFELTLDTHTIIPTEVAEDPEEPEVPGAGKTVVEVTLDSYTSNAGYYKNWAKIAVDTVLSDIAEDNLVFRNDEEGSVDIKLKADEKYMFTTGHLQYLAKIRHNELENYGLGTTYDTMHISYDIKVPEGDGATTRNLTFNMLGTTNSGSDNHFLQTTLVVNAVGNNFSVESSGNKPFSGGIIKTAAITNGVWQTVNVYTYLNESGTVDVVVTVGEEIIYTGTSEATHLGLYQVEFYSNNDEGTEANGTYYDNFRVALNSSEYVPVYVEPLEEGLVYITKEDSGDVTVYALGYESGSAVLVMAVYDKTTGKLLKNVFTSTTVTDGTISGTVAASEVSTGNIVKGFVFDSMSTMKPIATHSTLEY